MATPAQNLPAILTVPELDLEHLDKVREVAEQLLYDAQDFQVTDDATYAAAIEIHDVLKLRVKAIETHRTERTGPINKALQLINADHKTAAEPLTKLVTLLSSRAGRYFSDKQAKAEAEQRRQAAVLQARQEKAAAKAMERGEEVTPIVAAPTPMVVAPETTSRSAEATGTWRDNVTFEITDESLIPHEHAGVKLWTLDLVAIRKLNNAGVEIPGVKRVVEKVRATRGF
jgi:hypothetical protein